MSGDLHVWTDVAIGVPLGLLIGTWIGIFHALVLRHPR